MNTPESFSVLVSPELIRLRGTLWLRSAIVALFVGLMALFCTVPASQGPYGRGAPLQPVALPSAQQVQQTSHVGSAEATQQVLH